MRRVQLQEWLLLHSRCRLRFSSVWVSLLLPFYAQSTQDLHLSARASLPQARSVPLLSLLLPPVHLSALTLLLAPSKMAAHIPPTARSSSLAAQSTSTAAISPAVPRLLQARGPVPTGALRRWAVWLRVGGFRPGSAIWSLLWRRECIARWLIVRVCFDTSYQRC